MSKFNPLWWPKPRVILSYGLLFCRLSGAGDQSLDCRGTWRANVATGELFWSQEHLISVLALPAVWSGHEPSRIICTLLDVLLGILRLDFAYARLSDSIGGGAPIDMVRLTQRAVSNDGPGATFQFTLLKYHLDSVRPQGEGV